MMELNDKKFILDFLSKHKLMSLGTYNKVPWAASVYFLVNDNFDFYFISNPATRHCKNIAVNRNVSITVADSSQKSSDKKMGFQARGLATKVSGVDELKGIISAWNKRGFVPITYKLLTKAWKSKFYRIRLKELQMFDENMPEEKEVRVWKI